MGIEDLEKHLEFQLKNIENAEICISEYMNRAYARTVESLAQLSLWKNCGTELSPWNADRYCVFLWFLSNEMFLRDGDGHNAEKVYCLNRMLNAVDLFYEIDLPSVWFIEHPVGSVIGRGKIGEKFIFQQCCSVRANRSKNNRFTYDYPVIGDNCIMYSNSAIIGKCRVGNHVIVSAGSKVCNVDIPDYCVVFPSVDGKNPVIKKMQPDYFREIEKQIWK